MSDEQNVRRLYSVTTLLDLALGKGPGLMTWIANQCSTFAVDNLASLASLVENGERDAAISLVRDARWRTTKKAGERGTIVHSVAEALALGVEPVFDEYLEPWVGQYKRFIEDFRPSYIQAEAPVYNMTHHYAGTLDAVVEIDGRLYVLDVKTTDKKPGESRPPWPETALQLVAYQRAELVGVSPLTQRVDGGRRYYVFDESTETLPLEPTVGALVLVVSPYDYQLCRVEHLDELWNTFRYCIEVARWRIELAHHLYLPITPQVTA